MEDEQPVDHRQDFRKPFLRARRTIRHLWHVTRGDKAFNPNGCDQCKEIHNFLTNPSYLGDEHDPIGVERDPEPGPMWQLGPDEMEMPSPALLMDCEVCDRVQPFVREENGDLVCTVCKYIPSGK